MAEKCHFSGEFSKISSSKRSLDVCTTVVQLGIFRLMVQNRLFMSFVVKSLLKVCKPAINKI